MVAWHVSSHREQKASGGIYWDARVAWSATQTVDPSARCRSRWDDFVQNFNDPVVLSTVNEIETLATGLSGKIWQKITLLERVTHLSSPQ